MTDSTDVTRSSDPDVELLAATARGDFDAFELLVERHQERLLRVAERLLGDREVARDAVQEVFLKAFRKASSFSPRAKVSTWLYRIVVNHCLNRLRRRKIVRFVPFVGSAKGDEDAVEWEPASPRADPARELEARRRWQATERDIASLPDGQRAVLVLTKMEGLAYREVAEVLGITMGAVESRLFRAMRNLERAQERRESRVE